MRSSLALAFATASLSCAFWWQPASAVAQHGDPEIGQEPGDWREQPTAHGGHGAGHHDVAIDWAEMSASFVNFGVWLFLIVWFGRKPLAEFLRNRRASVLDGIEEARRIKEQAQAKYAEYSERIRNLDAELERLRDEVRRGGLEERDRIVAEAAKKAEKMRAEARFLVEQQMKQLRADLMREAIEAAVRAAEEILRKETTPQDHERLADEYLRTIRGSLRQKMQERQP